MDDPYTALECLDKALAILSGYRAENAAHEQRDVHLDAQLRVACEAIELSIRLTREATL